MRVVVRGGPLDGKTDDIGDAVTVIRVPTWNGRDYWTDGHPSFPVRVPACGAVEYHRTTDVVDGRVVFT